jgi:hypothetical protein
MISSTDRSGYRGSDHQQNPPSYTDHDRLLDLSVSAVARPSSLVR